MAPIFSTNNFQVIEHGIRDTTNTPAVSLVVQTTDADTTKLNHPRTIYQVADKAARDGWLKKLGFLVSKYHAEYLGWEYTGNPHDVTLQDFPPNYEMFMDISPERKDLYLCGSRIVTKFRSPQEFHPHLVWLMAGKPLTKVCECHYCAGTPRSELKEKYPLDTTVDDVLPAGREPASGPVRHQLDRERVDPISYKARNVIMTTGHGKKKSASRGSRRRG